MRFFEDMFSTKKDEDSKVFLTTHHQLVDCKCKCICALIFGVLYVAVVFSIYSFDGIIAESNNYELSNINNTNINNTNENNDEYYIFDNNNNNNNNNHDDTDNNNKVIFDNNDNIKHNDNNSDYNNHGNNNNNNNNNYNHFFIYKNWDLNEETYLDNRLLSFNFNGDWHKYELYFEHLLLNLFNLTNIYNDCELLIPKQIQIGLGCEKCGSTSQLAYFSSHLNGVNKKGVKYRNHSFLQFIIDNTENNHNNNNNNGKFQQIYMFDRSENGYSPELAYWTKENLAWKYKCKITPLNNDNDNDIDGYKLNGKNKEYEMTYLINYNNTDDNNNNKYALMCPKNSSGSWFGYMTEFIKGGHGSMHKILKSKLQTLENLNNNNNNNNIDIIFNLIEKTPSYSVPTNFYYTGIVLSFYQNYFFNLSLTYYLQENKRMIYI